ncbi:MAG: hypothetical protein A2091_06800 [Desulfuromonadales bacterium GWD2_61_12]|nr:MAG: hypothetical protein A2005_09645 [Desulfuromonadales bacterium GWC2_61_20]OGR36666.1 MAG: hypothetical protein A2091_06800 [Desulfuromonadales bacterium GWD2_61_12]HBT83798.1 hypothetical protein [Desulfuromonas sp.]
MANQSVLKIPSRVVGVFAVLCSIMFLHGCIIYSKPAYSGRVVDIEDGKPIKNVEITVEYWVGHQTFVEQNTKKITMFTTKTDENGYFFIRDIITLKDPFSWDDAVVFSVEKKGYTYINMLDIADCLSEGCQEKTYDYLHDNNKKIIVSSHLIKLSKL